MVQPELTIEQGKLSGSIGTDIRGNSFFKFQGIPYAKPPLGELRFKASLPPEKWTGVFDATKEGDVCYAKDPFKNGAISGSENCLFLNVFTKKLPDDTNTELSPVLFWIHGGGFTWGSGSEEQYGPDFLITEDVVLVTINYRLGLLGFLSLEDPTLDIPGNAGLKDQVKALKWVQKNISKFGGDPNNVTIFGESAGGASVHLLVLSPLAKGLFHKAIAQSGCALNPWVQGTIGTKLLATLLNLEGADDEAIYDSLMKKSGKEIFEIQEKMPDEFTPARRRPLGFVIERTRKEPFLTQEPSKIIKSGDFSQVPFMMGYTTAEGMIFDFLAKPDDPPTPVVEDVIPHYFEYRNGAPETKCVADKITKFYFGNEEYSQKLVNRKYDMFTDTTLLHGISVTLANHITASKAPLYLYRLSAETNLNYLKNILKTKVPGASHMDDVGYLFNNSSTPEIVPGSAEDISLRKIVKLWTNFAKFGNPTPEQNDALLKTVWKPVTGESLNFLDIGIDLVPSSNPDSERINFWKKLFAESPAGQREDYLK